MCDLKEKIALAIFNAELSKNDVCDLTGDYKSLWADCLDHANDCIKKRYLRIDFETGELKEILK